MNKTVDLSQFSGFKSSNFSLKELKSIVEANKEQLEAFMHHSSFIAANGITFEVMDKAHMDGVVNVASIAYCKHNPLMKTFKIPPADAEEYFDDEICDDEDEYSEMSVVALKDGKVIGFISCDDEFDLDDEDEEDPAKKDPTDDEPYPNKDLDDYTVCVEELIDVVDEGMDIEAKDEGENAYITAVGVLPEFHKQGVASALFILSAALTIHLKYKRLLTITTCNVCSDKLEEIGFAKMCKGMKCSNFEIEESGDYPFEDVEEDFTVAYHGIELN